MILVCLKFPISQLDRLTFPNTMTLQSTKQILGSAYCIIFVNLIELNYK